MVTIGDVLGIVAFLGGVGLTSWALVVCCGLLFSHRVEAARDALEASAIKSILRGIGLVLVPGILSFVMIVQPNPLGKFLGWMVLLALLAVGAVGAAGVSRSAGRKIQLMQEDVSDYAAFSRGAAFLVTGSMLPALGWFFFGPMVLIASLGCGWAALSPRTTSRAMSDAI